MRLRREHRKGPERSRSIRETTRIHQHRPGRARTVMLGHALKEWAVVCWALAEGRQAILLRKGGIAEAGDGFRLEHRRFWLYPTYVHQQRTGIREDALPLLEQAEAERPPAGVVRLTHFGEVSSGVYQVHDLAGALILSGMHLWSLETVRSRFAYRTPGLFVLPVRVSRAEQAFELPESASYAGCRSWVELEKELPDEGTPVLTDEAFRNVLRTLDDLLNPTAFA